METCVATLKGVINGQSIEALSECSVTIGTLYIKSPVFLWLACVVLILLTAYFAFRFIIEAEPLIIRLRKLKRQIQAIQPRDKPIDGIGLEQLRTLIIKHKFLATSWNELEETLLVDNRDNQNAVIYNTHQADNYFHFDSIINTRVNLSFFLTLPSVITSLGLLMTFIAILIGLNHIHPAADGTILGVEELVYSLSGKFISSITALVLATLFTFLERRLAKSLHSSFQNFLATLNSRFARMPAEHLLRDISKDVREQAIVMRQFGTDLSGHLKESVREGMDPLIQRVVLALEELARQKKESLSESFSSLLGEFKSSLMGSTNSEFRLLAEGVGRAAALMEQTNQQAQTSQQRISDLLASFDAVIQRQSSSGQEHIARLSVAMEAVLEKLRDTASSSSTALGNTTQTVINQMQQAFLAQSAENAQRTDEVTTLLKGVADQVKQAMTQSSVSLERSVSSMLSQTSDWSSHASQQVSSLLSEHPKNLELMDEARHALTESLVTFRKAVDESSSTLQGLQSATQTIQQGVVSLNSLMADGLRLQQTTNEVASLAGKNLQKLTDVVEQQANVLNCYQRTFAELDKSIGQLLFSISGGIENYSSRVKSSLEEHLSQFDNALANATAKLGTTVQQLSDSLEDLVDLASEKRMNN